MWWKKRWVVYRGVHTSSGALAAVKMIPRKQFEFAPDKWETQKREIDMLKLVHHPG
jgi:serine/threonine protein kinase